MRVRAKEILIEKWMNFKMDVDASLKHAFVEKVICLHTTDLLFNLIIYGLGTGEIYISMDIKVQRGLLTLGLQNRHTVMISYYAGIIHGITQNIKVYSLDKLGSTYGVYSEIIEHKTGVISECVTHYMSLYVYLSNSKHLYLSICRFKSKEGVA